MWLYIEEDGTEIERRDGVPDLDTLQEAVGGYIEAVTLARYASGRRIVAWVNEEGKLARMKPTARLGPDILVGPVVITAVTRQGDTVTLHDREADRIGLAYPATPTSAYLPDLTVEVA